MERVTRLEPATPTLARLCSTTELRPHTLYIYVYIFIMQIKNFSNTILFTKIYFFSCFIVLIKYKFKSFCFKYFFMEKDNEKTSINIIEENKKPIEDMSFDDALSLLKANVDFLEKNQDDENAVDIVKKCLELKEHCAQLLSKEKAEIIEIANQNNIPLDSLGLDEENNDDEEDSEDDGALDELVDEDDDISIDDENEESEEKK